MSTYMPKAAEVERSWYILDAADKPLGRVAATRALSPPPSRSHSERQAQADIRSPLRLRRSCDHH